MGIALVRFPAYEMNLVIFTGSITGDELVRFCSELDSDDPTHAPRWLTYVDETADFSSLPVTAFPQAKHVAIPIVKQHTERPGYRSAVVCTSGQCGMITDFWRAYVQRDPEYVSHPGFFADLKDACDWLKLPDSGCEAIAEAIRAEQAAQPERAGDGPRPGAEAR
jgi:hypothetical protein